MRMTTLTLSRGVLSDIQRSQQALSRTQEKLSSGKELTRVSDNPYAVGRALQLRSEMESAQQLQQNVGEAKGWTEVTDGALETVNEALQRVRELVIQGATDTATGLPREQIATEVKGLIESIKAAANATYGGNFIFSGTDVTTQPYQAGSDAYAPGTNVAVMQRQIGPGVTIDVNVPGKNVIGDGTSGMLKTLRDVVTSLEADDGPAISASVAGLDVHLDNLNSVRAQIGANYSRLEIAEGRLMEYEGTTLKLLSETEDADMAKTMIDFSTQQAAMQAGLQAGSRIVQNSLLDFLR
jgi:flagellar hook-associated protein 3 FlgL